LHELIVETAGNAHLLGMHRPVAVYVHIASFRSRRGLRRADEGLAEHQQIAAAYDRRDPDRAVTALTRHVERSRDVVLSAVARTGGVL
jgi:DNA-binding GntR family transcriptional regulator